MRREPTDLAGRDCAAGELKPQVSNVALRFLDARTAKGTGAGRKFSEPVEKDGDVVNGEVPDDIDILPVEAEIDARKAEVVKIADLAGVNELFYPHDGGTIDEGVPGHQGAPAADCQINELVAIFRTVAQGLFHEDVLAGGQGTSRKVIVRGDRSCDGDGVQICLEEIVKGAEGSDVGILRCNSSELRWVDVAASGEDTPRALVQNTS
jgi:hypothetical protein